MTIIQAVNDNISKFISGDQITQGRINKNKNEHDVFGGARIKFIYNNIFRKDISQFKLDKLISNKKIYSYVYNSTGISSNLFIPQKVFYIIVDELIERIKVPSLKLINSVTEEIKNIIKHVITSIDEINRFKNLR